MAYCRLGDSDIYLYPSADDSGRTIVCCVCRFAPLVNTIVTTGEDFLGAKIEACPHCAGEGCKHCQMHGSTFLQGPVEALEHVAKHRAAGDYVPTYVDDQLRKENAEVRSKNEEVN